MSNFVRTMTNEQAISVLKSLICYYNDLNEEDCYVGFDSEDNEALNIAIHALEQQPKTGEWIDKGYDIGNCWATCSECDGDARGYAKDTGWGHDYYFPKFCPHCGARMNGGGEE